MTQDRLRNVRRALKKRKLDCLLVSSVPNITYLTAFPNFSKEEREAFLLITKDEQFILTDGRYKEAVRNQVDLFTLVEVKAKTPMKSAVKKLIKQHLIKRIGIEENNLTVSEHEAFFTRYNDTYHYSIESLRVQKDPSEIEAIGEACRIGDLAFARVLKRVKEGVTERQLANRLESLIKQKGADVSFPPIVAFGGNSAIPHHKTSDQPLAPGGQFVLIDFGVKVDNYCSDMTRTVFFGKADVKQRKMYDTVLTAQQKAIDFLSPTFHHSFLGKIALKASQVDRVARRHIESCGFPTIPHALGHGIGLEVHEPPRLSPKSKDKLEPGTVFSIEPGVYLPGFGGVRIEDLIVLEFSGPRFLTNAKRELTEL